MWTKRNLLVAAASLLASGTSFGQSGSSNPTLMAQSTASERPVGRHVLVAGAGAVAEGKSPATISIDLGNEPLPPRPKLELTLAPSKVAPNERYLIVVSLKIRAGQPRRLGTVSFYRMQQDAGSVFYFDAGPIGAERQATQSETLDLSVALVPVDRSKTLTGSAVRILAARIVGG